MSDLSTTYLGLPLRNPLIVGASGLTANLEAIKQIEQMGAGAIVIKSLFEEQVQLERFKFDEDLEKHNYRNAEMITIYPDVPHAGPAEHLMWVREAKRAAGIPVFASLNAVNPETWVNYARRLEATGVDGLECNFFAVPAESDRSCAQIEDAQIDLVRRLKSVVSLPISVKLSVFYSQPVNVARRLAQAGASGIVLFNRLFEPDIDIQAEELISPFNLSHDTDYRLPLRYAGLLEGTLPADLCCSGGIFSGADVVKMILAGANAVQTVSALYRYGFGHLRTMLTGLEQWMDRKGYRTLADFRGKLSQRHLPDPWGYTRAQYVRLLMDPQALVNNAPVL